MRFFAVLIGLILSATTWAGPRYAIGVDGLACPFCAYGLEKRLNKEKGVEKIETEIANGRIIVEFEDDTSFSEPRAKQAVEDAGFTLRSFDILSGPVR